MASMLCSLKLVFVCFFAKLFAMCTISDAGVLSLDSADGLCYLSPANDGKEITTGLTISTGSQNIQFQPGSATTISLKGSVMIIYIKIAVTLSIRSLILLYNQPAAANGFALVRVDKGGLVLEGVVFGQDATTTFITGAPILVSEGTLLTIDYSCKFTNFNNTKAVPTDDDIVYGGVINADLTTPGVTINIKNSQFIKNSITNKGYGGAFVFSTYGEDTKIVIENVEFTDCTSGYYAGAFDLYSEKNLPDVTIKNCNFTRCTSGRDSGAIWVEMAMPGVIESCNFTDCTAKNDGGGIYLFDDYAWKGSNYTVKDCKFLRCISEGERNRPAQGAAILVESTGWTKIESCSFDQCVSNAYHGHGGAISDQDTNFMSFTIKLCNFTGCKVDADDSTNPDPANDVGGDGGAVSIKISLFNTIIIDQCKFTDCSASNHGGSLDIEGGSLIVNNSAFTNSKAISGNGGSIRATGVIVSIENTVFTNSQLGNPTSKGVEIYSEREIIHYGSNNVFACAGDNDVIYKDVSLKLVVCDHKTIEDLDCSANCTECTVCDVCKTCSAADSPHGMSLSLLRTLFFAALVVLMSGLFLF